MFQSILLDGGKRNLLPASGSLVGHRHNSGDIESLADESVKTFYCEIGRAEKYYFKLVFSHLDSGFEKRVLPVRSTRHHSAAPEL